MIRMGQGASARRGSLGSFRQRRALGDGTFPGQLRRNAVFGWVRLASFRAPLAASRNEVRSLLDSQTARSAKPQPESQCIVVPPFPQHPATSGRVSVAHARNGGRPTYTPFVREFDACPARPNQESSKSPEKCAKIFLAIPELS
jgi:hypothetical protein